MRFPTNFTDPQGLCAFRITSYNVCYTKLLRNGMSVIKIPGLNNNEINGVHVIEEIYIEPYNEEYGVYVADVIEFDTNKLYDLNDNHTWLCSFKEYANWAEEYRISSLTRNNFV